MAEVEVSASGAVHARMAAAQRPLPLPGRISAEEAEAHAAFVGKMGESAIWSRYAEEAAE